jgi:hypothetical protein
MDCHFRFNRSWGGFRGQRRRCRLFGQPNGTERHGRGEKKLKEDRCASARSRQCHETFLAPERFAPRRVWMVRFRANVGRVGTKF